MPCCARLRVLRLQALAAAGAAVRAAVVLCCAGSGPAIHACNPALFSAGLPGFCIFFLGVCLAVPALLQRCNVFVLSHLRHNSAAAHACGSEHAFAVTQYASQYTCIHSYEVSSSTRCKHRSSQSALCGGIPEGNVLNMMQGSDRHAVTILHVYKLCTEHASKFCLYLDHDMTITCSVDHGQARRQRVPTRRACPRQSAAVIQCASHAHNPARSTRRPAQA